MRLETQDCRECDGSGYVVDCQRHYPPYRCPDCEGTGHRFLLDGSPVDVGEPVVTDGEGEYYMPDQVAEWYDEDNGELLDGTVVYRSALAECVS